MVEVKAPVGFLSSRVDDSGRLRLPTDFRQTIEAHPEWFLVADDEQALHLKPGVGVGHRVEVDSTGRMLIPAELSAGFKNKEVRLVLTQGKIKVTTGEEFEKLLSAMALKFGDNSTKLKPKKPANMKVEVKK